MRKYQTHTSIAAALNRNNVDTDQIIAKQFLKKVERTGFGKHLFHDWRFQDDGSLNPDFELNHPAYQGAKILIAGDNFGCGSSREHAPWAIADYGFNTVISSSFADIFYNNCFKNGILPIQISDSDLAKLMQLVEHNKGIKLTIDLTQQVIISPGKTKVSFELDAFRKHNLLEGLDDIALTLQHIQAIEGFEKQQQATLPWLWPKSH